MAEPEKKREEKPKAAAVEAPSKEGAARRAHEPGKRGQLIAAVAVAAALPLLAYLVHAQNQHSESSEQRDPLDPVTTNEGELRRVHEAVSRVLAAAPSAIEPAVQILESVRAESPGARDLKESCVNTYRGLIRAQGAQRQARGLLLLPDGGERPQQDLSMEDRVRAETVMREAREQTELVEQSHDRCHSLYGQASERLHLDPVQRGSRR